LLGTACHITQRGVDRRETFSADEDFTTYLRLLRLNLDSADVRLLGWCLMPNHVHLIAVPQREEALSILLRRVHGKYAQYYNTRWSRTGHLWQNRFFACALGGSHLWVALAYVELNPVRAGLAARGGDYRWSSARSHLTGRDEYGILDMGWWRQEAPMDWDRVLTAETPARLTTELRACTYAGKPLGDEDFVRDIATRFGRHWTRGRPTKAARVRAAAPSDQFTLFEIGSDAEKSRSSG
jgi:putative transposase